MKNKKYYLDLLGLDDDYTSIELEKKYRIFKKTFNAKNKSTGDAEKYNEVLEAYKYLKRYKKINDEKLNKDSDEEDKDYKEKEINKESNNKSTIYLLVILAILIVIILFVTI